MQICKLQAISLDKNKAVEYAKKVAKIQCNKAISYAKHMGGGMFGKVVRVHFEDNTDIVIKFLLVDGMLEKEVNDLKLLAENCIAKMPKVLFVKPKDKDIEADCYGMQLIDGKPLMYDLRLYFGRKKTRLKIAEQIVDSLHSIHQCTNDKFGDTMCADFDTWQECYKPFAKEIYDVAKSLYEQGQLSKKIFCVMDKAWEKFDIIFEEKVEKASLIHGDLNVLNIMVDKRHKLSGFIDPLNSMYADDEYDLFQFYNLTGKRFCLGELYKQKYGASKNFEQKIAFYGLWNEVFCYIKSGILVPLIMNPLIKNMKKVLKKCNKL